MHTSGASVGFGLGVRLVLTASALVLPACGGDGAGGGGSCGAVQPCGGSLIGTWTVNDSCQSVTDFTFDMACPEASIDQSAIITSGSLTFNADMTVTVNLSQSGTLRVTAPLSCLTQVTTCDEYASVFSPGPPDATTTCTTVAGNACDCTLVYATPQTTSGSGTYTTTGSTLSWTLSGDSDGSYCVQGNTLHLMALNPVTGEIARDLIATK